MSRRVHGAIVKGVGLAAGLAALIVAREHPDVWLIVPSLLMSVGLVFYAIGWEIGGNG